MKNYICDEDCFNCKYDDCIKDDNREYRERNKDKIRAYKKEYYQKNRSKILEHNKQYQLKKEGEENVRQK